MTDGLKALTVGFVLIALPLLAMMSFVALLGAVAG